MNASPGTLVKSELLSAACILNTVRLSPFCQCRRLLSDPGHSEVDPTSLHPNQHSINNGSLVLPTTLNCSRCHVQLRLNKGLRGYVVELVLSNAHAATCTTYVSFTIQTPVVMADYRTLTKSTSKGSFCMTNQDFCSVQSTFRPPIATHISKFQIIRANTMRSCPYASCFPIQDHIPTEKACTLGRSSLTNGDEESTLDSGSQRSGRKSLGRWNRVLDRYKDHWWTETTV